MMDGHLSHLLVTQRGWTPAAIARWLADSLSATLLKQQTNVPFPRG